MFRTRSALLVLTAIALAACATLPEKLPRPAPAYAMPAQGGSVFAPIEASIRVQDGPDASGFLLLDSNEKGLTWRLALIDSAKHSLDLQYYVWFGDASGTLLMKRTVQAADRGVKVRILLDDLNSMLRDMTTPEIRDGLAAAINAHPNIEMRLFNAWRNRSFVGRGADTLADPDRLNRRMHNKVMIADNQAVILGGRNIGDEYMGLNADFNFHDLDVLGIGPVARQASAVFDRFWNSDGSSLFRHSGFPRRNTISISSKRRFGRSLLRPGRLSAFRPTRRTGRVRWRSCPASSNPAPAAFTPIHRTTTP